MIKKILLVVLVLLVAGIGYIYFSFGSLLRQGVEVAGTSVLQTEVTVGGVSVSPLSGSGGMQGLRIANPEGFNSPYAMELDNIEVSINIESLLSDVIEIYSIVIDNPAITYETRITSDNFRALLENISGGGGEASSGADSGASKRVIIREFDMRSPKVTLAAAIGSVPIPLPDIHLTDIGSQEASVTLADAARQILSAINRELVSANLPDVDELMNRAQEELGSQAEQLEEEVEETVDQLRDSLRGLL